MENGGCTVLGEWLDVLPDGTYPNLSVVQEMLGCLDSLEIQPEYLLAAKRLGRVIKIYANDRANMPQVASLAKTIMDKWSRMVFGISTTYVNRTDEYEDDLPRRDQYRKLKAKLERMQAEVASDESDPDADPAAKARKKQKSMGLLAE